jgi:hypothetical protein
MRIVNRLTQRLLRQLSAVRGAAILIYYVFQGFGRRRDSIWR